MLLARCLVLLEARLPKPAYNLANFALANARPSDVEDDRRALLDMKVLMAQLLARFKRHVRIKVLVRYATILPFSSRKDYHFCVLTVFRCSLAGRRLLAEGAVV